MTPEGLVLTNRHVIEGAQGMSVTLKDGRTFDAEPVAVHDTFDLALIKISAPVDNLPILSFAALEIPAVGDDTVIIGHPREMRWTLTAGKVSALRGSEADPSITAYLQTDAAANPGNSGGPVLNMKGYQVGVVVSKLIESEGMTFAIYKDIAAPFVREHR